MHFSDLVLLPRVFALTFIFLAFHTTPSCQNSHMHKVALRCSKRPLTFAQQCWKQQGQAHKRTVEFFWAVSALKWSHPFHLLWLSRNRHSSHGSSFGVGSQVSPLGSNFSHWDLSKAKISHSRFTTCLSWIGSRKTQVRKSPTNKWEEWDLFTDLWSLTGFVMKEYVLLSPIKYL